MLGLARIRPQTSKPSLRASVTGIHKKTPVDSHRHVFYLQALSHCTTHRGWAVVSAKACEPTPRTAFGTHIMIRLNIDPRQHLGWYVSLAASPIASPCGSGYLCLALRS